MCTDGCARVCTSAMYSAHVHTCTLAVALEGETQLHLLKYRC